LQIFIKQTMKTTFGAFKMSKNLRGFAETKKFFDSTKVSFNINFSTTKLPSDQSSPVDERKLVQNEDKIGNKMIFK